MITVTQEGNDLVSMELDDREQRIIDLAQRMLNGLEQDRQPDELEIDGNFIFHFDPVWCRREGEIRGMMGELLRQTNSDEPFSVEDAATIHVHLARNSSTEMIIRIDLFNMDRHRYIDVEIAEREMSRYRCLDPQLREVFNPRRPRLDQSHIELMQQREAKMMRERWLTLTIHQEILRMGQNYHILPLGLGHSVEPWTPRQVRDHVTSIVNWILRGEQRTTVPPFPPFWEAMVLIENDTGTSVARTVHPWEGRPDEDSAGKRGGSKYVRMRTWAIYYLTVRGGGRRTEDKALDLWAEHFNEIVDERNYQRQRDSLFLE